MIKIAMLQRQQQKELLKLRIFILPLLLEVYIWMHRLAAALVYYRVLMVFDDDTGTTRFCPVRYFISFLCTYSYFLALLIPGQIYSWPL